MLGRRVLSFLRVSRSPQPSSSGKPVDQWKNRSLGQKAVSFILITVTGGVALSAIDDLAIFLGCSCKAMDKASKNQEIAAAIGEPIARGPWYNASLAVAHKGHSASCTFPISGPMGNGVLRLKAIRDGDDGWFSFLRHRDWEILILDALLHVPCNDEKQQTLRINLSNDVPPNNNPPACTTCTISACKPQDLKSPDAK